MTEIATTSPPIEKRSRWWFVHASIVAAFVLFFIFVGILYWRWLLTPEPTSIIRIAPGNDALAGAIVRIEGGDLSVPIEIELTEENDYGTRIYLVPGDYRMEVRRPDGTVLFREGFAMGAYYVRTFNLRDPRAQPLQ